jgi:ERF superfamily
MSGLIYQLIPKVMKSVPFIPKLREHGEQHWAFRGFEDFLQYFRPALLEHGLFIVPEVLDSDISDKQTKNNKPMIHIILRVAYTVFAPDGSSIRATVVGESWDTQDNASTKALDDAFTSFLTQVFCVPVALSINDLPTSPRERTSEERTKNAMRGETPEIERRKQACISLRALNRELGHNEAHLHKMLVERFKTSSEIAKANPMNLEATLRVLTVEQIENARRHYEAEIAKLRQEAS